MDRVSDDPYLFKSVFGLYFSNGCRGPPPLPHDPPGEDHRERDTSGAFHAPCGVHAMLGLWEWPPRNASPASVW